MYCVLTILAALILLPFGALVEGPGLQAAWKGKERRREGGMCVYDMVVVTLTVLPFPSTL
eukprot:evm.model.NODE_44667_length_3000_cov_1.802000.1